MRVHLFGKGDWDGWVWCFHPSPSDDCKRSWELSSHHKCTVNSYLSSQMYGQLLFAGHYERTVNSFWLAITSVQSTSFGWSLPVYSQLLLAGHYQCTVNSFWLVITNSYWLPPFLTSNAGEKYWKKNTFFLNILYFVCFIVVAADTVVKQSYKGFILLTVELLKG